VTTELDTVTVLKQFTITYVIISFDAVDWVSGLKKLLQ